METKKAYQEKKEAFLKDLNSKVEELKKIADQGRADVKVKYHEQMEALRVKQDRARTELKELIGAGEDRWEALKDRVEAAFSDLKKTFESTFSKFRK
ncbi:MAG: coiled coil domain-containing protein [Deltaproteobacteria bacterium]|nr:coiled coil domain-containing protein [Deltaproteobacteria bacterium]